MMIPRSSLERSRDTGPGIPPSIGPCTYPPPTTNAVAAVCLHAGLTATLLIVTLQVGLPLVAAAGLAWLGGACATVALLLASDATARRDPLHGPQHAATAPDL